MLRESLVCITKNARNIEHHLAAVLQGEEEGLGPVFDALEEQARAIKALYEAMRRDRWWQLIDIYDPELRIRITDVINERENILIFIATYPFIAPPHRKQSRVLKTLAKLHFDEPHRTGVYGTVPFWRITRDLEDCDWRSLRSLAVDPSDVLRAEALESDGLIESRVVDTENRVGLRLVAYDLGQTIVALERALAHLDEFIRIHFEAAEFGK